MKFCNIISVDEDDNLPLSLWTTAAGKEIKTAKPKDAEKPRIYLLSDVVHDKNRRRDIWVAIERYHLRLLPPGPQISAFHGLLKAMLGMDYAKDFQEWPTLRLFQSNCPGGTEYELEPPYRTINEDEEGIVYPDIEEIMWLTTVAGLKEDEIPIVLKRSKKLRSSAAALHNMESWHLRRLINIYPEMTAEQILTKYLQMLKNESMNIEINDYF